MKIKNCKCTHCDKNYTVREDWYNGTKRRGFKNHYCSKNCQNLAMRDRAEYSCNLCGKTVTRSPSGIQDTGRIFCSKSCAAKENNKLKRKCRRSKMETMLFERLKTSFSTIEFIPNDRTLLDGLEIDIAIPKLKIGIEWNGIVHFQPIYGQEKLQKVLSNDSKKQEVAREKGISLIIISDLESNKKKLDEAFNQISNILKTAVGLEPTHS